MTTTIIRDEEDDWIRFDPFHFRHPDDCQIRFYDEDFGATIRLTRREAEAMRDALARYVEGA